MNIESGFAQVAQSLLYRAGAGGAGVCLRALWRAAPRLMEAWQTLAPAAVPFAARGPGTVDGRTGAQLVRQVDRAPAQSPVAHAGADRHDDPAWPRAAERGGGQRPAGPGSFSAARLRAWCWRWLPRRWAWWRIRRAAAGCWPNCWRCAKSAGWRNDAEAPECVLSLRGTTTTDAVRREPGGRVPVVLVVALLTAVACRARPAPTRASPSSQYPARHGSGRAQQGNRKCASKGAGSAAQGQGCARGVAYKLEDGNIVYIPNGRCSCQRFGQRRGGAATPASAVAAMTALILRAALWCLLLAAPLVHAVRG